MKISLNCKLADDGAYGFIKPIADIKEVELIRVFRDTKGPSREKIKYYTPFITKPSILCQLYKLIQMLFCVPSDTSVSIGIYEIPHGLLALLVGKLKKIPVTVCIIGDPGYIKLKGGRIKFLMYFLLKHADAVTVTGSIARKILIDNGVNAGKIHILPNAFDAAHCHPEQVDKKFDILSLSYFTPEKHLLNFVKIVALLKQKIPNIKAAIAGMGPEKENIENAIHQAGLDQNIRMLGFVDDPVACFRSTRLFVLTSSTEGLPRTVIEAMACGIPSVASNVGDITDLIKNNVNGFVVDDFNSIEDFAEKIIILLTDKNRYDAFSERAVEFVRANYSPADASKVWEEIFKQICGKKNG
jgi:glycosyltransferase involved in cell wall biosynthesis